MQQGQLNRGSVGIQMSATVCIVKKNVLKETTSSSRYSFVSGYIKYSLKAHYELAETVRPIPENL